MSDSLTASASAIVNAPAAEVFDFVCRPENHPEISGDRSVKGTRRGAERLSQVGDKIGMSMKMYGLPYRITSKVVEYEDGAKVAWCHLGRHRWRWEVEAIDDSTSKVTETFDMSTSPFRPALRLMGYPKAHEENVERSVANVAAHFNA